jgi:hypothetical protein
MECMRFPGCCAAEVMFNFGGHANCAVGKYNKRTVDEIKIWIQKIIKARRISGFFPETILDPTFVVITNDGQTSANKALRELGFSHSPWIKKKQHPDSRIRIWWLPAGKEV